MTTTTPRVLNYKQIHGIPNGAVYIGRANRGLKRSKWANPFVEDKHGTLAEVIAGPLINDIHELRGKDLVCWCKPDPCHGDLLLRLANA